MIRARGWPPRGGAVATGGPRWLPVASGILCRVGAEPHDSLLRRADETAALAATAVTMPVNAAAPVVSMGFLRVRVIVAMARRQPFLRRNICIATNL